MSVQIIHRDSMHPKDHTTSALDTRCWENSNLEVNRINLDEQESIFLFDHAYCSFTFYLGEIIISWLQRDSTLNRELKEENNVIKSERK